MSSRDEANSLAEEIYRTAGADPVQVLRDHKVGSGWKSRIIVGGSSEGGPATLRVRFRGEFPLPTPGTVTTARLVMGADRRLSGEVGSHLFWSLYQQSLVAILPKSVRADALGYPVGRH